MQRDRLTEKQAEPSEGELIAIKKYGITLLSKKRRVENVQNAFIKTQWILSHRWVLLV
jgi:hypothetical protein